MTHHSSPYEVTFTDEADTEHRVVCTVLAEQVAALREHIDNGVAVGFLWSTSERMSWLSSLVLDLSSKIPSADVLLNGECNETVATIGKIRQSLDEMAFLQAQRHDIARQIADCVVTALNCMATTSRGTFTSQDLSRLYVSEGQRLLHEVVAGQLNKSIPAAPS